MSDQDQFAYKSGLSLASDHSTIGNSHSLNAVLPKIRDSKYANHPLVPEGFDPLAYLEANPDVLAAQIDPFEHWVNDGRRERRRLK